MVKLFAPAMSLDATGTVADAMTFSKWKGRNYLRKRSTPTNPKTGLQVGIRSMFKFITQNWDARSAAEKATWSPPAIARTISPFNAWLGENVQRWKRFEPPGIQYPVGGTGAIGVYGGAIPTAYPKVRSILIDHGFLGINQNWALLIFRGDTGFSTAVSNLVHVLLSDVIFTMYEWLDTGLDPGTYYYNTRNCTLDGFLGPEQGEISATATA